MAALLAILAFLVPADHASQADAGLLAFANTPRRPGNLLIREGEIGRSAEGRPIELRQFGDPSWNGELLIFGCAHGDGCGASEIEPLTGGCPDPSADILLASNLGPRTQLAARVIRAVRPAATVWFRQYRGRRPFIHAGGDRVLGARSFVVNLPRKQLNPRLRERLSTSLVRMGRRVRED